MKQSFIFGGFLGFAACFVSALSAGSDADTALRDAALCGLIMAMLFRWLYGALHKQVSATQREREESSAAEAAVADGQPGVASAA